ncbi:hypothetical protein ACFYOH_44685, partial [Streptomyces sp. NPDC007856]
MVTSYAGSAVPSPAGTDTRPAGSQSRDTVVDHAFTTLAQQPASGSDADLTTRAAATEHGDRDASAPVSAPRTTAAAHDVLVAAVMERVSRLSGGEKAVSGEEILALDQSLTWSEHTRARAERIALRLVTGEWPGLHAGARPQERNPAGQTGPSIEPTELTVPVQGQEGSHSHTRDGEHDPGPDPVAVPGAGPAAPRTQTDTSDPHDPAGAGTAAPAVADLGIPDERRAPEIIRNWSDFKRAWEPDALLGPIVDAVADYSRFTSTTRSQGEHRADVERELLRNVEEAALNWKHRTTARSPKLHALVDELLGYAVVPLLSAPASEPSTAAAGSGADIMPGAAFDRDIVIHWKRLSALPGLKNRSSLLGQVDGAVADYSRFTSNTRSQGERRNRVERTLLTGIAAAAEAWMRSKSQKSARKSAVDRLLAYAAAHLADIRETPAYPRVAAPPAYSVRSAPTASGPGGERSLTEVDPDGVFPAPDRQGITTESAAAQTLSARVGNEGAVRGAESPVPEPRVSEEMRGHYQLLFDEARQALAEQTAEHRADLRRRANTIVNDDGHVPPADRGVGQDETPYDRLHHDIVTAVAHQLLQFHGTERAEELSARLGRVFATIRPQSSDTGPQSPTHHTPGTTDIGHEAVRATEHGLAGTARTDTGTPGTSPGAREGDPGAIGTASSTGTALGSHGDRNGRGPMVGSDADTGDGLGDRSGVGGRHVDMPGTVGPSR